MIRSQTTYRRETSLGSRWAQTVSCYRITSVYLLVATVVLVLLLTL